MTIAENLAEVRGRIERAAAAAGRDPATVRLVAVSKTKPASMIREAYDAGQRDFGENYAQELADKVEQLADLRDLRWHFIGHLQSNKAKLVVPTVHLMHTVHSASIARELARRAVTADRRQLDVLVEVNAGAEAQKHGIAPGELDALVRVLDEEPRLRLRGLMTIPPADAEGARAAFSELARLRAAHDPAWELSMGMSEDLELAVDAGATLVRVGSAIFGRRG